LNYQTLSKSEIFKTLYNRFNGEFLTLKDLPHPHTLKDMKKAVRRVANAIINRQKIALIGDYDVDGVSATTIIRELFYQINYPLEWIIPNRFSDGYGISKSVIDRVDANLIITVDNGIAGIEAGKICKERNIELIITDHHSVGDTLPQAYAIVNQKQSDCNFKYKEICGAQIAWYFASALSSELNVKVDLKHMLGICALAIVADIMPLNGINRSMLIAGLQQLQRGNYPFVKALEDRGFFKSFNSEAIAFYIAPLINSAGRLKDANIASEFLFTKDLNRAYEILDELIELNNQRKSIEKEITKEAIKQVKSNDSIAIVWGKDWNEGVVGIVAARVAEYFKKPAIALSCKDGICKGSGRSFGDCDLFSLATIAKEHYLKFGGHKMALGLSFKEEKLPLIKSLLNIKARELCSNSSYQDDAILGILPFLEIDFELLNILDKFEPYGEANPKPKFITQNVEIIDIKNIGQEGEHKKYRLKEQNRVLTAIEFKSKNSFNIGDIVNITYTLSKNEFNNNIYINLYIEDIQQAF